LQPVRVREDPRLTPVDRRALTPLFWTHINRYAKFTLEMDSQLDLNPPSAAIVAG